jgi:hypothetical protein
MHDVLLCLGDHRGVQIPVVLLSERPDAEDLLQRAVAAGARLCSASMDAPPQRAMLEHLALVAACEGVAVAPHALMWLAAAAAGDIRAALNQLHMLTCHATACPAPPAAHVQVQPALLRALHWPRASQAVHSLLGVRPPVGAAARADACALQAASSDWMCTLLLEQLQQRAALAEERSVAPVCAAPLPCASCTERRAGAVLAAWADHLSRSIGRQQQRRRKRRASAADEAANSACEEPGCDTLRAVTAPKCPGKQSVGSAAVQRDGSDDAAGAHMQSSPLCAPTSGQAGMEGALKRRCSAGGTTQPMLQPVTAQDACGIVAADHNGCAEPQSAAACAVPAGGAAAGAPAVGSPLDSACTGPRTLDSSTAATACQRLHDSVASGNTEAPVPASAAERSAAGTTTSCAALVAAEQQAVLQCSNAAQAVQNDAAVADDEIERDATGAVDVSGARASRADVVLRQGELVKRQQVARLHAAAAAMQACKLCSCKPELRSMTPCNAARAAPAPQPPGASAHTLSCNAHERAPQSILDELACAAEAASALDELAGRHRTLLDRSSAPAFEWPPEAQEPARPDARAGGAAADAGPPVPAPAACSIAHAWQEHRGLEALDRVLTGLHDVAAACWRGAAEEPVGERMQPLVRRSLWVRDGERAAGACALHVLRPVMQGGTHASTVAYVRAVVTMAAAEQSALHGESGGGRAARRSRRQRGHCEQALNLCDLSLSQLAAGALRCSAP